MSRALDARTADDSCSAAKRKRCSTQLGSPSGKPQPETSRPSLNCATPLTAPKSTSRTAPDHRCRPVPGTVVGTDGTFTGRIGTRGEGVVMTVGTVTDGTVAVRTGTDGVILGTETVTEGT